LLSAASVVVPPRRHDLSRAHAPSRLRGPRLALLGFCLSLHADPLQPSFTQIVQATVVGWCPFNGAYGYLNKFKGKILDSEGSRSQADEFGNVPLPKSAMQVLWKDKTGKCLATLWQPSGGRTICVCMLRSSCGSTRRHRGLSHGRLRAGEVPSPAEKRTGNNEKEDTWSKKRCRSLPERLIC